MNLVHAVLFLLLGMAVRAVFPGAQGWRIAAALFLLGGATELVQVFVPGRHPRFGDAAVDLAAGMAGWAIARVASACLPARRA